MKHLNFFLILLLISATSLAQGNSHGKAKGKDKNNDNISHSKQKNDRNNNKNSENEKSWEYGNSTPARYSNHQPKKVIAALTRDYPGASNISWSKYKGDYTATFNNGIWRSTAVYHANGERRDTRTVVTKQQLPGTIWDKIFKRDQVTPTQYIQIERPSTIEKIFRILSTNNTAYYYDQNGNRITYIY